MGEEKKTRSRVGRPDAKTNQRPKSQVQGYKQELRIRF